MKKITLITSGQPSTNPRLVKEADALAEAGYNVKVIYQFWNRWASEADRVLLKKKNWKYVEVGGNPSKKVEFLFTKALHKIARLAVAKFGIKSGSAELAISRSYLFLYKEALREKSDLYIAHNLGALPVAVKAAKHFGSACGFDAEDFHRFESVDDPHAKEVMLKKHVEDQYIPRVSYATAASPLIAREYKKLYTDIEFTSILNVFPRITSENLKGHESRNELKLFWFSQTVGLGRGLEEVIEAIGKVNKQQISLHLLGECSGGVKESLQAITEQHGLNKEQIVFYAPVEPEEIFVLASKFDIGLATETGRPFNRDICLTNKIFTYIQAGLAVIASDTQAQNDLLAKYPLIGKVYLKGNTSSLATAIHSYLTHTQLLKDTKLSNWSLGQEELNWNEEKKKFLKVVEQTLS